MLWGEVVFVLTLLTIDYFRSHSVKQQTRLLTTSGSDQVPEAGGVHEYVLLNPLVTKGNLYNTENLTVG